MRVESSADRQGLKRDRLYEATYHHSPPQPHPYTSQLTRIAIEPRARDRVTRWLERPVADVTDRQRPDQPRARSGRRWLEPHVFCFCLAFQILRFDFGRCSEV